MSALRRVLFWGRYLLLGSFVFSGHGGQFINPVVMAYAVAIECGVRWLISLTRTNHGARQLLFALGVSIVGALALGVRHWTVGLVSILLGNILNLVAVYANGLRMPVPENFEPQIRHTPRNSRTRLWWLCDCMQISGPDGTTVFSVGDLLQVVGWWVFSAELWLARL